MVRNWIDCPQRFYGLYSACYRLRILGLILKGRVSGTALTQGKLL